jgi:tetratricopeptide (TPR) repeat protein
MKTPAGADIRRWSDEVARDPRSLAFLPLARAYRRQGLRNPAIQLCLRGLDAYPSHAEAHGLLALLYLEAGDHQRAADEWSIVLRIDADNFDALRGMGFCYLEQGQLGRARQVLERAALQRPSDVIVQEALQLLHARHELAGQERPSRPAETGPPASAAQAHGAPAAAGGEAPLPANPANLFDDLLGSGQLLGALLVDAHGLVLAGRLGEDAAGDAAQLGALLGGAVDEAVRTVAHLRLGAWRGILLESAQALLHLSPGAGDTVVILAAGRNTPPGWLLRASAQAAERAARHAEVHG